MPPGPPAAPAGHRPSGDPDRQKADLVLPAASFAEADGTVVNMEGRAQRFFQVYAPAFYDADIQVREGWRWLAALQGTLDGKSLRWQTFDRSTMTAPPAIRCWPPCWKRPPTQGCVSAA
ncbi:molybdopterin-dependent oxidoreductase [Aeromonas sp. A-5]|uniref:molybdopterin-dependent oxidoreductase n=1 Tax=Aeromonas ichthyocola TaxID=3367746 RepID=UPI0038F0B1A5